MIQVSGIYKITSIVHPKRMYIGSAINLLHRQRGHLEMLKNNKHTNFKLQRHYNKYGKDDLTFDVLYLCDNNELIKAEQFFIDSYKPWFNINMIAGSNLGKKFSKKARKNMSISHIGLKHNEKTRQKHRELMLGNKLMLGRHLSVKTKIKIVSNM